jgi:hypothetical protein
MMANKTKLPGLTDLVKPKTANVKSSGLPDISRKYELDLARGVMRADNLADHELMMQAIEAYKALHGALPPLQVAMAMGQPQQRPLARAPEKSLLFSQVVAKYLEEKKLDNKIHDMMSRLDNLSSYKSVDSSKSSGDSSTVQSASSVTPTQDPIPTTPPPTTRIEDHDPSEFEEDNDEIILLDDDEDEITETTSAAQTPEPVVEVKPEPINEVQVEIPIESAPPVSEENSLIDDSDDIIIDETDDDSINVFDSDDDDDFLIIEEEVK